jgi:hypothetical protein
MLGHQKMYGILLKKSGTFSSPIPKSKAFF